VDLHGLRFERTGAIGNLILDRPPVNALSTDVYESLIQILIDIRAMDDINVVVLSSAHPRIFSAGADIKEVSQAAGGSDPGSDVRRQQRVRNMLDLLVELPQPTIAVVNGAALGAGAGLAASCDIRVGSVNASIGLPEINVGRCGGARHLMRLVPQGVVRQMYFTGEPLDADTSFRLGLLNEVHPQGEELAAAFALAAKIAAKSPYALRLAKEAVNGCEFLSLKDGYAFEQGYTLKLGRSNDAKEAARAFVEKREPVWTNG
jgi:enoyl-CoA hydratase